LGFRPPWRQHNIPGTGMRRLQPGRMMDAESTHPLRRNPMPLGTLQHYTIEPSDLERTRNFYCDVLGLENGYRPPLDFPGYWLYSGGVATVHLMGTRKPREGIVVRGTEKKYDDTGRLDHIAFAASDVDGMRKRLQSNNVKFRESIVPRSGDTQLFLYDPDGVGVELNFPKA
jgi:catechol 2,3-dioxygenase-like lactoylglutathione lyase family enzyme